MPRISLLQHVTHDERPGFERELTEIWGTPTPIGQWQQGINGSVSVSVRADNASEYIAVRLSRDINNGMRTFRGLNLLVDPWRNRTLLETMATNSMRMTPPNAQVRAPSVITQAFFPLRLRNYTACPRPLDESCTVSTPMRGFLLLSLELCRVISTFTDLPLTGAAALEDVSETPTGRKLRADHAQGKLTELYDEHAGTELTRSRATMEIFGPFLHGKGYHEISGDPMYIYIWDKSARVSVLTNTPTYARYVQSVATSDLTIVSCFAYFIGGRTWLLHVASDPSDFLPMTPTTINIIAAGIATIAFTLVVTGLLLRNSAIHDRMVASQQQAAEAAKRGHQQATEYLRDSVRNPLQQIGAATEMLQGALQTDVAQEDAAGALSDIRSATSRIDTLVKDVELLAQLDAGNVSLLPGATRVRDLMRALAATVHSPPYKRQCDVSVDYVVSLDVPDVLETDAGRLMQLLGAALSNAVRFASPVPGDGVAGGTGIFVGLEAMLLPRDSPAAARINLQRLGSAADPATHLLRLSVDMTSEVGLGGRNADNLFDPFAREAGDSLPNAPGDRPVGMGLRIAYRLAHLLGGVVDLRDYETTVPASSSSGDGIWSGVAVRKSVKFTSFAFVLPVTVCRARVAEQVHAHPASAPREAPSPRAAAPSSDAAAQSRADRTGRTLLPPWPRASSAGGSPGARSPTIRGASGGADSVAAASAAPVVSVHTLVTMLRPAAPVTRSPDITVVSGAPPPLDQVRKQQTVCMGSQLLRAAANESRDARGGSSDAAHGAIPGDGRKRRVRIAMGAGGDAGYGSRSAHSPTSSNATSSAAAAHSPTSSSVRAEPASPRTSEAGAFFLSGAAAMAASYPSPVHANSSGSRLMVSLPSVETSAPSLTGDALLPSLPEGAVLLSPGDSRPSVGGRQQISPTDGTSAAARQSRGRVSSGSNVGSSATSRGDGADRSPVTGSAPNWSARVGSLVHYDLTGPALPPRPLGLHSRHSMTLMSRGLSATSASSVSYESPSPFSPLPSTNGSASGGIPPGLRVLHVDDEDSVRKLLRRMLEKLGCSVTSLEDGAEVEAHLRELGQLSISSASSSSAAAIATARTEASAGAAVYDVILLDMVMPRSSGLAVCKRLVGELRLPIPVIAATGNWDDAYRAYGFAGHIAKPFAREKLAAVLQAVKEGTLHREA